MLSHYGTVFTAGNRESAGVALEKIFKAYDIRGRVPEELDRWLQEKAGGARRKAAFIRELVERERAAERERELLEMFNAAAAELTEEDHAERERLVDAFSNRA